MMQRLRTDTWRRVVKLSVPVGTAGLVKLVANGWVELQDSGQGTEARLTADGLDALRAKIPVTYT